MQLADECIECMDMTNDTNLTRQVYIYPSEFNVIGLGSSPNLSYRKDDAGNWRKDFNIYDHLGNLRVVMRDTNANIAYLVKGQYDYKPFGEKISITNNRDRTSFIGKQKDWESDLCDLGVRKYDDFSGRFMQIEPLWEKQYDWSPYVYSMNNPINYYDNDGFWFESVHEEILREAAKGLVSGDELEAMVCGIIEVDEHQEPENQYLHGMLSAKDVEENGYEKARVIAEDKLETFVNKKLNSFIKSENNLVAFASLGQAIHPITDLEAPAHTGWQIWSWWTTPLLWHAAKDKRTEFTEEAFQKSVEVARNFIINALELKETKSED